MGSRNFQKGCYKSCWQPLLSNRSCVSDLYRHSVKQRYTSHYPINPLTCCYLVTISFPQRQERAKETTVTHLTDCALVHMENLHGGENNFICRKYFIKIWPQ